MAINPTLSVQGANWIDLYQDVAQKGSEETQLETDGMAFYGKTKKGTKVVTLQTPAGSFMKLPQETMHKLHTPASTAPLW